VIYAWQAEGEEARRDLGVDGGNYQDLMDPGICAAWADSPF